MKNKIKSTWLLLMWLWLAPLLLQNTFAANVMINWKNVNVWDETIRATNVMYRSWVTKLPLERQNLFWNSERWEAALLIKRFWNKIKKLGNNYSECNFSDTSHLSWDIPEEIVESCTTWLFQWAFWKFMPNNQFTRWQTILVFARLLARDQAPFKEWSYESQLNNAYNFLLKKWIIHVDDRANSSRAVTREEMYLMMYRIVQLWKKQNQDKNTWVDLDLSIIQKTFDSIDLNKWLNQTEDKTNKNNDIDQKKAEEILNTKWTDVNVVAFKDKNVFDQTTLPTWSSRIILQKVWVKNNQSKDMTLNDVKFELKWLVSHRDISKVYLLDENMITSSTASFTSDWTASVYARSWLNTIKAWETKYYYVAVDTRNDRELASNTFSLRYTFNFDSSDNLKVWWNLTQNTVEYRFVAYTTQQISIEWYNTPATKVYVWDEQKLVWSFQLEVWASNVKSVKDVYLQKIILTNDWWRIDDKLKNVKLKVDWKVVSDKVEISRDKVSVTFRVPTDDKDKDKKVEDSSVLLERWQWLQVDIYADIIWWSNDDKIKFHLKNNWDLVAVEKWTNLPLNVKQVWHKYFKEFKIQAWKLVISKANNSPVVDTISPDSKEMEILRFKVANPAKVTLEKFKLFLSVHNKNLTDNINVEDMFKNVKIYKCSSSKNSSSESCTNVIDTLDVPSKVVNANSRENNIVLTADNFRTLDNWDVYYAVKAQTSRYAKENVDFKFVVTKDSFDHPENTNTNDRIDDSTIVWSADSNYWSIWKSNINVNYMNNWEDLDFVKWKANATAWEFVISSNNVQDLKINQLRLQFYSDTPASVRLDQITNVRLEYQWNTSENRDSDSNWYVTFDWLNIRIKKWEQLKLKVKFDLSSSFTDDTTTKNLYAKIWTADQNLVMTTANWQTIRSDAIWWLPITSETVKIHNSWKLFMYKTSNQKDVKTLYDYNKFEDVFEFTLKSRFDDIRIKDLYVIAYRWTYSRDSWTAANIVEDASSYINQIRYSWWVTAEANVVRWIAKFENLWDDIKANTEKNVKIAIKTNNIRQADRDNKKVKFAIVYKIEDAAHQVYKTKVISLSNWEVLWDASVDWADELETKEMRVRKTMIKVDTSSNWLDKNIVNWSEHQVFKMVVENKWSWKAKIKQFMVPVTVSNNWAPITMNNFKVEFTNEWENSFINWSNIRNNMQIAVKEQWQTIVDADWKQPHEAIISEAWTKTYNIYVRFTWNYNNWIEVQWQKKIALRMKAQIWWSDTVNDSVKFDYKTYEDALDWEMKAYNDYSVWAPAMNSIIWTDNADSNSNTQVDHVNWFEDQWVEWNYSSNTLTYKS